MTIAHFLKARPLVLRGLGLGGLLVAGIVGYTLRAAQADIPATNALVYSGTLMDGNGVPLTAPHNVEIGLYDVASGGTPVCPVTQDLNLTPDASGGFKMQLDDGCMADIEQNANLWLEVKVGGTPVSRTQLGAVPYAVAAKDSVLLNGSPASAYTYANGTGISLSNNVFSADTAYLQRRAAEMGSECNGANESIKTIAADGTVTCEADNDTTYVNGAGLALNGTTFSIGATTEYWRNSSEGPTALVTAVHAFCALSRVYSYNTVDATRLCYVVRNVDSTWSLFADSAQYIECRAVCF